MRTERYMKDYFNILGVNNSASEDEIKKAYRTLAMKHHPDRGGDQNKFQEIQEAYSVLTDPQRRAEWESMRNGNPFGGNPFHFNFNFGGHPFDVHDIFNNMPGANPFGQFRQQRRNRDLKVVVDLDLASTLESQTKHISVKHLNGTQKTVTVQIPRGVHSSVQMKYAGHGDQSYADLPAGDLYIHFRVHENPNFINEGLDLIKVIKLNCLEAIIGTETLITGLDGKTFEIRVPPGAQQNFRMRIAQQGLWSMDHPVRGNLIVHIDIVVPTDLTNKQMEGLQLILDDYRQSKGARP